MKLQPPSARPFVLLPFGCEISVKTNHTEKYEAPGERCLFLGWKLQPGLRYRGEQKFVKLSELIENKHPIVRFSEAVKTLPGPWSFPAAELAAEALLKGFVRSNLPSSDVLFDEEPDQQPLPAEGSLPIPDAPAESSQHEPSSSSSGPQPPQPSQSADSKPSAPVGRPATLRPPHWSSTPELIKEWSNFSHKKRVKLSEEYRKNEAATALVSSLVNLLTNTASQPSSLPEAVEPPTCEPPPVWYQPTDQQHREYCEDSAYLMLVTRQLCKRDTEYHSPDAVRARESERDKLIANVTWEPKAQEYHDAKREHPDAKFTIVFTITGIKHSEDPSKAKFKARSVARGNVVLDSRGSPILFGDEVSAHASNLVGMKSVATYGGISGTGCSLSDAEQAFVQPRFSMTDRDNIWFVELPPELLTAAQLEEAKKFRKPVYRLLAPLYGIPPAPKMWKEHLHHILTTKCDPPWEPVVGWSQMYVRMPHTPRGTPLPSPAKPLVLKTLDPKKVWRQVLSYYVDDGAMSGSFQAEAWIEIGLHVRSTRPEPLLKVLGVGFDIHALTDETVAIDSEMSDYFAQSVAMYEALPDAPPLSKHPVPTPYCEPKPELEQQPGDLAQHALSLVMKLLFGARMAGMHIVFAICALACQVTQWSKQSDADLQRLFSYIKWNPFMIRGLIDPSEVDEIVIGGYPTPT